VRANDGPFSVATYAILIAFARVIAFSRRSLSHLGESCSHVMAIGNSQSQTLPTACPSDTPSAEGLSVALVEDSITVDIYVMRNPCDCS